jgi:hypothetical protein
MLLVQLAVIAVPVCAQGATPATLRVGAAKVDITPSQSDLVVATDSIRDHQFARAIVVDDGKTCAVFLGIDSSSAEDDLVADAFAKTAAATRCPAQNFVISATHSHSTSVTVSGVEIPSHNQIAEALAAAAAAAQAHLAPARVGYATTSLDLNVNRDLLTADNVWIQGSNYKGPSDKTLAVVAFIGADNVPIGVLMNYGAHPINFFLTGVVSSDFPGEAERYVETAFDERSIAIFTQSDSGDQNPQLAFSPSFLLSQMNQLKSGHAPFAENAAPALPVVPPDATGATPQNPNLPDAGVTGAKDVKPAVKPLADHDPIPAENLAAYRHAIDRTGQYVTMMGQMVGTSTIRLMRENLSLSNATTLWGERESFSCPGRTRVDRFIGLANAHVDYTDGPDAIITVGLLRIGDINFATVDGEIFSRIGLRLKSEAPVNKLMIVTRATGYKRTGYIYANEDSSHLTFEVLSSRLKPGCAEDNIVSHTLDLMHKSGEKGMRHDAASK